MRDCIDEGVLQGYLDDELSPETMKTVADHFAACGLCASALREAENETAIFAAATAPEMSLSVPTERLRERLEAAISRCDAPVISPVTNSGPRVRAWLTSFNLPWHPALSFAVALIVIGIAIGGIRFLNARKSAHADKGISQTSGNSNAPGAGREDPVEKVNKAAVEIAPPSDEEINNDPIPPRVYIAHRPKNADRKANSKRRERIEARLTPSEKEAVKARLMLALHITGAKLNYTQKKVIQNIYRQPVS